MILKTTGLFRPFTKERWIFSLNGTLLITKVIFVIVNFSKSQVRLYQISSETSRNLKEDSPKSQVRLQQNIRMFSTKHQDVFITCLTEARHWLPVYFVCTGREHFFLDRNPTGTIKIKTSTLVKGLFVNETWCNGTLQCEFKQKQRNIILPFKFIIT